MPKRPKAKVKTTTPTEKQPSKAKQARKEKQEVQAARNTLTVTAGQPTPWQLAKGNRRARRILEGRHEKWQTKMHAESKNKVA
jgi:hypothetical protein